MPRTNMDFFKRHSATALAKRVARNLGRVSDVNCGQQTHERHERRLMGLFSNVAATAKATDKRRRFQVEHRG
jgi:hypothetical protein